jgi:ABC-type anion transport system duplicated permease subunit
MFAAYLLSILFTLLYGYFAAHHNRAGYVIMPLLDVLQSVPILSFLPVVLLGLSAFLPQSIAAEIASVVLIFTSQVWNLTSAWLRRTCEAAVRLISQVAPSLVLCQHAGVHGILGHAGRR